MRVIKKDAAISNTGDDDAFPGSFEVILSAPTEDRDGDTLLPEDWETPLPEHITFDQDHAMSVAGTVGSGTPKIDEETGNLIVTGTYSSLPRAQEVRTLVKEGHIRTTSVAFMTKKVAKAGGDGYKIVRELLNGAFVAIPSNREALVLSSKSGARNNKNDAAMIQTVHDHAIALGASCANPSDDDTGKAFIEHVRRRREKALAGSLEAVQERIRAAVGAANPDSWAWIRGTVPDGDGGGYIVFELEDMESMTSQTYRQAYTDDGDTVTLQGEAERVKLEEVVGNAGNGDTGGGQAAEAANEEAGAEKSAPAPKVAAPAADNDGTPEEKDALAAWKAGYASRLRLATMEG